MVATDRTFKEPKGPFTGKTPRGAVGPFDSIKEAQRTCELRGAETWTVHDSEGTEVADHTSYRRTRTVLKKAAKMYAEERRARQEEDEDD